MSNQRKRLPLAERIRKGLEEGIRHAKGEITLETTTLEMPDRPLEVGAEGPPGFHHGLNPAGPLGRGIGRAPVGRLKGRGDLGASPQDP